MIACNLEALYDIRIRTLKIINKQGEFKMILADKILSLRKSNGWSQDELAEKMNVSRQSISKWESAAAIPDINRILELV